MHILILFFRMLPIHEIKESDETPMKQTYPPIRRRKVPVRKPMLAEIFEEEDSEDSVFEVQESIPQPNPYAHINCYVCGERGHLGRHCPQVRPPVQQSQPFQQTGPARQNPQPWAPGRFSNEVIPVTWTVSGTAPTNFRSFGDGYRTILRSKFDKFVDQKVQNALQNARPPVQSPPNFQKVATPPKQSNTQFRQIPPKQNAPNSNSFDRKQLPHQAQVAHTTQKSIRRPPGNGNQKPQPMTQVSNKQPPPTVQELFEESDKIGCVDHENELPPTDVWDNEYATDLIEMELNEIIHDDDDQE